MLKIAANTIRSNGRSKSEYKPFIESNLSQILPQKAKILAWGIFLIYFIENGTLGIIPRNLYFVYRNVRISDLLIYGLTIYSVFNNREFLELYKSKSTIILKLMLMYFLVEFLVSCMLYDYNILEYFFRLKGLWTSFLIFPFLLLMKRGGLPYMVKLMLPVAIVSNVLYILSSISGIAFLPEIGIEKQSLPGGLEVYRVFGGTFYGEYFFLGFVYNWITNKFRFYQLFLVILFAMPQILAFGRAAWIFYLFTLALMFVWYALRKRKIRIALRQAILLGVLGVALIYGFMKYIPRSDYLTEAISARIQQGEDDFENKEGTYGSRIANIDALIQLWMNNNVLFGIGMHPLWVVKPVTVEENIYAWGFSDVGWAAVLAAYGAVGFLFALYFQVYFLYLTLRVIRLSPKFDIYTFLALLFFSKLFFDGVLNYSYSFFTACGSWGFWSSVYFIAATIYKNEHLYDE